MFMSRVRILAALIAATSAVPALAQEAEPAAESETAAVDGAVAFAKELTANATAALTSSKPEAEQFADFQQVLADGMALDVIGKFMIGDTRKSMSEDQLARFGGGRGGVIVRTRCAGTQHGRGGDDGKTCDCLHFDPLSIAAFEPLLENVNMSSP